MNDMIHTLQDFMLHTESNTYILMGVYLVCMVGFWMFLTQKDEEPVPRNLPMPKVGDFIVVGGAGGYGFSMSSNYNSQPLIPEVIVEGDQCTLTRRRQTLDDILREENLI